MKQPHIPADRIEIFRRYYPGFGLGAGLNSNLKVMLIFL